MKRQQRRLERCMTSRQGSYSDNSLMVELGTELSSILPKLGMFASVRSAPGRIRLDRRGLLDLDETTLLRIVRQLDGSVAVGRDRFAGADLRSFSEKEFVALVGLFVPHLKEVQLATSRLFRVSSSPYFLFSMINLLSVFGMTYEQVPVLYDVEDLCRIISLWRHSSRSHSCEVYIREPRGCDKVNWMQYGTIETDGRNRVKIVRVNHLACSGVVLTLNFH
ncbi:hypothetical protein OSTOST_14633 [Ostertagia ostertagi]